MKTSEILAALTALCLLPAAAGAQAIINDWTNTNGIVSDMTEGTVQEGDYAADGIFSDWSDTVSDFVNYDGGKDIDEKVAVTGYKYRDIRDLRGRTLNLPTMVDENGIDLFLLTREGITIYLALDNPVYHQEPDDEIIKWIRYYAYERRRYTASVFRRYAKWEAFIKNNFGNAGVPEELAELCLVESGCTYEALSSAGALGMWQIMPDTGRSYGLAVNSYIDERRDPVKSTLAAARILASNYSRTGDWTLAAAGYNCGAGRILTEIKKGRNTWERMKATLPKETSQYIPALLAMHYVWTYREKLGIGK